MYMYHVPLLLTVILTGSFMQIYMYTRVYALLCPGSLNTVPHQPLMDDRTDLALRPRDNNNNNNNCPEIGLEPSVALPTFSNYVDYFPRKITAAIFRNDQDVGRYLPTAHYVLLLYLVVLTRHIIVYL